MKIAKNPERTTQILDLIRETFIEDNKKRNEDGSIHLSSLLTPKMAYWQKVKPLPPSDSDIQYFIAGRGHEDAMHRVTGLSHVPSKEWQGIKYGIDFYHGHPSEMKTRRRYAAKEGEELERYDHYLKQLLGYCAVEFDCFGYLWVWSLMEKQDEYKTAPEFVLYDVEFTISELQAEQKRLLKTKDDLLVALPSGLNLGHRGLPNCPKWMCVKTSTNVVEGQEPFCFTCLKIFASDKNIDKHSGSKSGAGHKTRRGTYNTTVIPMCRYYKDCLPQLS